MKGCVVDEKHRSPRYFFKKNTADIYQCPDCGCLMADIDYTHAQYEAKSYYTMGLQTKEEIENKWGLRWRYLLGRIGRFAGNSRPLTLLDVGAGNGYFVFLASTEFGIQASGLGIHEEENRFARDVVGVKLINEDIARHRGMYDIVTCFNVIEHVTDPRPFLSALMARVHPGGILVVSTPSPTCIRARVRGLRKWERIDPPHHINLFTKKALRALLARHPGKELGYETISTYITFVNTKNLFLRKFFFQILRMFNLGADQVLMFRKALL